MERRFLVFAGALTVVAIAMGAGLILLAKDKVRKTNEMKIAINSNFISNVRIWPHLMRNRRYITSIDIGCVLCLGRIRRKPFASTLSSAWPSKVSTNQCTAAQGGLRKYFANKWTSFHQEGNKSLVLFVTLIVDRVKAPFKKGEMLPTNILVEMKVLAHTLKWKHLYGVFPPLNDVLYPKAISNSIMITYETSVCSKLG